MKDSHTNAILSHIPTDRPFTMIEIGVWKGKNAEKLLAARPLLRLTCIDPWAPPVRSYAASEPNKVTTNWPKVKQEAERRLSAFDGRATILQNRSVVAASEWEGDQVDLIFIDGEHTFEAVKADIDAWIGRVKPGGWLGGHDFKAFPEVGRAVKLTFRERYHLAEGDTWWHRRNDWA